MAQSLSQIYVHLIFSTKNRHPFINKEIKEQLHAYIAGTLKNLESPALMINSVSDHIHILFRLSRNHSLSKIVEETKKESSKWIKTQDIALKKFSWQAGYGAFSVSSTKVETVKNYISNQEEHHRKISFQEEVEEFMRNYSVEEYDPVFFWK